MGRSCKSYRQKSKKYYRNRIKKENSKRSLRARIQRRNRIQARKMPRLATTGSKKKLRRSASRIRNLYR